MSRHSPTALALASGLALLALHGAAQAQHDHLQHHAATPAPAADAAPHAHAHEDAAAGACTCPRAAAVDADTAYTASDARMDHLGDARAGADHDAPHPHPPRPTPPPAHAAHAAHTAAADDHAAMGHRSAQDTASDNTPTTTAAHGSAGHAQIDHAAMDHSRMDHAKKDQASSMRAAARTAPASATPRSVAADHADHAAMGHGAMQAAPATAATPDRHALPAAATTSAPAAACACANAAPALPREPIPPITAADRAAAFAPLRHPMAHVPPRVGYLLFDRLEAWDTDSGSGQAWEASAWYGGDIDRLWLRSEGERGGGRTEAADLEVLYGRAVSPWWDLLVGMKQDFAPGRARGSAAFGVQGMAPYKFEVAATLYLGDDEASVRMEGEYDVLLSNRLILQPRLEADVALREDRERGIGRGLGSVEAGLRLRYEVTRRFAPYVGLVHERSFGDSADYRRAEGESARDTRIVAGVRVWF